MGGARRIGVGLIALAGLALAPGVAQAKKAPTYNSPGYKGTRTAPKTNAPGPQKPIALSTPGDEADSLFGRPTDMLVDEAGTAHIVWSEDNGDGADALRYCRLKRGATGCDNPPATRALVPDKPYEAGDGPQFNSDDAGPKILRIGDQLVLLTFRFPTTFAKPDADASISDTVLAYVSGDGGNTFGDPAVVGQYSPGGGAIVFGPDTDPTILTITDTTGVCGVCVATIRPGQFSRAVGDLGADRGSGGARGYHGALALDGGVPVAAYSSVTDTFVRRWRGTGSVTDQSTWTASAAISFPGDEPELASGPGGLFVVNSSSANAIAVRRISGSTATKPVTVSDGTNAKAGALFEDPSGRLVTAFSRGNQSAGGSIRMRTSSGGTTWSASQELDKGQTNGPIALGAAADGGGFATFDVNKGTPRSRVVAVGFGSQAPTGRTGIAGVPGLPGSGATSGCTKIAFGVVTYQSTAGCFLPGKGSAANVLVTNGELNLNGLRIVPDPDVRILIDPKTKTLDTTGSVRVLLVGGGLNITLWHGELHVKLPTAGVGTNLFSFDTKDFPVNLKGFPLEGRVDVILTATGVRIPISLGLPKVFGGITGQATLLVDKTSGLSLDSMVFDVGSAPIGPLVLKDLHISYQRNGEVWDGRAELDFPGGLKLQGGARFEGGEFASGNVTLTPPFPPGIPLGPGVWLSKVGGGFALKPNVKLTLNGQFGALPVSPKGPFSVVVDGEASVTFGDPITFTFDGTGTLLGIQLSEEHATVNTDGYANFTGAAKLDLEILSVKGSIDVAIDGPRKLFSGVVNGNVSLLGHDFVDVQGVVSSTGVAGCYKLLFAALGFGYKWGDTLPEIMFPSCDLSAYKTLAGGSTPPGQPPAAIPGTTFKVEPGTPSISLRATGQDGRPSIVLVDPDGKRITPVALPLGTTEPPADAQALVVAVSQVVAVIGITKPKAGVWKIESAAGARSAGGDGPRARAAALSGVDLAVGLPAPTVSAKLGGKGRARTLAYRATSRKGLVTRFFEKGRGGTRLIGAAKAARGTLKFSTGAGPGGPRTIFAALEQDGVPRMKRDVAKYTAPAAPRLAPPRTVKVKHSGSTVTVTWTAAPGAAGYTVRLRATSGATLVRVLPAKARTARFTRIEKRYKVTATVAGRTRGGRAGGARSARG